MASLQRYTVRGKGYYRIVESRRVNGKPRAIPILHLGTADALLKRLTASSGNELTVKSFEHGGVAALKTIADELNLAEIINRIVPKKLKGVSAGDALVLMAINRLLDPCSKNSWSDWARGTSLFRLFPHIPIAKLSSQFFWEHMQELSDDSIMQIEDELVQETVKHCKQALDLLFFDTTNCYSYVADRNDEEWLFQYGHSKEKQDNRRLFGVELLVSRDSSIPIYHNTYPDNQHDSKLFPQTIKKLCRRLRNLKLSPSLITLVFDRGSLSEDNFKRLDKSELGFVSALRLGDIPRAIFDIPMQKFRRSKKGRNPGIYFYREKVTLWGKERTAVFYLSERARSYQTKILNDQINRRLKELAVWNASLVSQSGKSESCLDADSAKKKIASLLSGPYLQQILSIAYDPALPREKRLQFSINEKAKADIILRYFGKRCLITTHADWEPFEVIDAYFEQATVERAFRLTKDRHHIAIRPQFHRTNQSLRVHVFSCFLALLLGQVLLRKAQKLDPECVSVSALLGTLSSVRIAALLAPSQSSLANPAVVWKLEKLDSYSAKLFSALTKNAL